MLVPLTFAVAGCWKDLGTLGGAYSRAYGLNDAGVIVGVSYVEDGSTTTHAFIKRPGEPMEDLNGEHSSSVAQAVNSRGVTVGTAEGRAVWWGVDGTSHWIPLPSPSRAVDINDAGLVAGSLDVGVAGGPPQAFVYDTTTQQLTWLPFGKYANGINERGDIVGVACTGAGDTCTGAMWAAGTHELTLLPGVGGLPSSSAIDINDVGQILGDGVTPTSQSATPLLWNDPAQPPFEVPNPGLLWHRTAAISEDGHVAGIADARAFTWHATTGEVTWLGPNDRGSDASAINGTGAVAGAVDTPDEPDPEFGVPHHAAIFYLPR